MRTYIWKEYEFIGTTVEFAKRFGVCKGQVFVNAKKRVTRHVYNKMNAWEQAVYEKKRERAKPAYHVYLNLERTRYVDVCKKAYEAIDLPMVHEEFGMFKLQYRNIVLPDRFVGNGFDEIPVASAMEKYRTEAVRFAEQVMLATGYFNTRLQTEKPQIAINYTSLRLSYSNGIEFHFVSDRSHDGICDCYLQRITFGGKQIYNGCFHRHVCVDGVLRMTQSNSECQNADLYFID